ncbi:MAG: SIS domain-containing protein [Clostridia bacterium]|nr:SIS domain-containing protein [Clostridia bacterium]
MNNLMMEEIKAQASLFDRCATELIAAAKLIVKNHIKPSVNRVYITGCGDSYFAGMACKEAFLRLASLRCEAHQAMEFSRYVCPLELDENAVVFSISSSGKVARTQEAAINAKARGAVSIAVTANADTPLAKLADAVFCVDIPNSIALAPGTRSYAASQLALICLAIALGEERGTLSPAAASDLLNTLSLLGSAVEKTVDELTPMISAYVDFYLSPDKPNAVRAFHLLGSGPNLATAHFGSMKLLESCAFPSIPTGIEEWAHSQFFITDANTHVLFIAPHGASRTRALEVMRAVSVADGKSLVICEADDEQLRAAADIAFPIYGMKNIPEWLSHLVYAVPLEILSMLMGQRLNRQSFDFVKRPWIKEENFRQIYRSQILTLEDIQP